MSYNGCENKEEYLKWLGGLKIGDEVRDSTHFGGIVIEAISGETPTRWRIGRKLFRKSDGKLMGEYGMIYFPSSLDYHNVRMSKLRMQLRNYSTEVDRRRVEFNVEELEAIVKTLRAAVRAVDRRKADA